jgi:HlyD family secretion protein
MLLVELGERVVGTSMMSGTEMMRIADLSRMEARVEVNENDITRVKVGDTAIVSIDAYMDEKFKGVVTAVSSSAKTTGVSADQVTNFDVRVFVLPDSYMHLVRENRPYPLRPGMSVSVDIRTITKTSVLAVPIQAVTTRTDTTLLQVSPAGGDIRTLVFTTNGAYAFARDVKTGIQDNTYIEIITGINEGDRVIVAPFSAISKKLSDSTLVQIVQKEELYKTK